MQTATLDSRTDEDQWIWESFRYHSRTFSLATRFLPRSVQMPIATLYLFCRRVDTLADDRVLEVGAEQTLQELDALNRHLDATLAGQPPSDDLLWRRLEEVHDDYDLDRVPLYELIEGARWDLEGRTVDTLDDLIHYSNLVGGSVGAMMLPFLVDDDRRDELEHPARELGIAMQITNIVRDVGEDARELDRVYLPTEWLDACGVAHSNLYDGHVAGAYPKLLETVMREAEKRYVDSFDGIDALPFKCRVGIRGAARMYREIMNEVRANDYDNLNHRAYVSLGRKLWLVAVDNYNRRRDALQTATPGTIEPARTG